MKLDLVHDIQTVYRKVLNCMARPGTIENINEQSNRIDFEINMLNSTVLIMQMLLDAEVGFKVISKNEEEVTKFINQLTYSIRKKTEEADYIFISKNADSSMVDEAFRNAKIGDLIYPNKSATIVFEVEDINNSQDFKLTGPGINVGTFIHIETNVNWIYEREKKNTEYPLGIDLIFVDGNSNIACIPRTTEIREWGKKKWDM